MPLRRFIIVVVCVKAWFYSILFYFILFHLFSAELRDRQRKHQTKDKNRAGKNGNKENEVSEASAVKSRSEQETK